MVTTEGKVRQLPPVILSSLHQPHRQAAKSDNQRKLAGQEELPSGYTSAILFYWLSHHPRLAYNRSN